MAIPFSLGQQRPNLTAEEATGMPSFGEALHRGIMNFGQQQESIATPKKLAEQILAAQLQNKINQAKAKYADQNEAVGLQLRQGDVSMIPYRQRLLEAQLKHQEQLADQPFGGNLSGIAREAWGISQMTGQDPKEVAQELYKNKLEQASTLNSYRQTLSGTAGKRAATNLGKLDQEQQEVEQGFMPGTNGQMAISPEQQQEMLGQYQLQRLKLTSDVDTRKKSLFATNIDKTLDSINVDDLTQFGGLAGGIVKKMNEGKALTGNETESYRKYHDSLTAAKLLAKQVRQFYGDSITPGVQEQLSMLTNPSSWTNNPAIAKRKFNQFKSILKNETNTYRDATKNTNIYKGDYKSSNSNNPIYQPETDPLGLR
jgi:hypothetical protein